MIVITGASSGLGLEVAKLYKEAGKKVVNISRRECEYADINICISLREGPELREIANKVLEIQEPLETIIHCAGIYSKKPYGEITEDEIKLLMSSNVKPSLLLTSFLIERIESDETDILIVTSTAGIKGDASGPVYSASKWAARGIAKGLQDHFTGKPNRVIDFCPNGFAPNADIGSGNMRTEDIAIALKQVLDLPKNVEVSEIVINGK